MGIQIIKQPDGRYALWSSISDTLFAFDETAEGIVGIYAERARGRAEGEARETLADLDAGGKPYRQFAKTWAEAVGGHTKADCPPEYNKALAKAARRMKGK